MIFRGNMEDHRFNRKTIGKNSRENGRIWVTGNYELFRVIYLRSASLGLTEVYKGDPCIRTCFTLEVLLCRQLLIFHRFYLTLFL
jgi:hypothetical protein